jgi:hypothetical protein
MSGTEEFKPLVSIYNVVKIKIRSNGNKQKKQTLWLLERCLLGCYAVRLLYEPTYLGFLDRNRFFSFKQLLSYPYEAE